MSGAVKELVERLQSAEATVRQQAAHDLLLLEGLARDAALVLCRATGDPDPTVQASATAALESLGAPPHALLRDLSGLLEETSGDIAYWAATLLGRAEEDAASAADPLAQTINSHPLENVRERAAWALGKIGADTAAVRDALQNATSAPSARLARLARQALDELPER